MKIYSVCVVGMGSIGGLKPDKYDNPNSENILTIAHAVTKHLQTELVGVVDYIPEKAEQAAKKWNTKPYTSIDQIKEPIDIIAVCVPTVAHAPVLLDCLKLNPKLVIAEKPFTENSKDAKIIIDKYKKADVPIAVDYIRRYDLAHQKLAEDIKDGILGKIYNCKLTYNRGLVREASHFLNLCTDWFGEFKHGMILNKEEYLTDLNDRDKTYSVYLSFERCPHVTLHPVDGRAYSVYEYDIWTEQGRFNFVEHGLKCDYYPIIPEPVYGDYNTLCYKPLKIMRISTQLNTALLNLIDNCVKKLEGTSELICSGSDALKVHQIYDELKIKTRENNKCLN
jgi:predicted dehydrogenase